MTNDQQVKESELREILAQEMDRCDEPLTATVLRSTTQVFSNKIVAALAAMRRVSTPIPLTPSDEMVEAGARAMAPNMGDTPEIAWQHYTARGEADEYLVMARACLTAALNLMRGDK